MPDSERRSTGRAASRGSAGAVHLVGIGSSAGGLEALQDFARRLTPGTGAAYVIAQHMSPDHPSMLVDLLGRVTTLQVVAAVDGAAIEPDVITVCPPDSDIQVHAATIHLLPAGERVGPSPNIDLLFESIAEHWGERGVAVVLSGTGSDGAQGVRQVRAAGGLTIAQAPDTARFDSMPRAAAELGGADLVLAPFDIAARLTAFDGGGDWTGESLPAPHRQVLVSVATRLKQATGIDFSRYKESTLRRQVRRRMAIRQVTSVEDYLPILTAEAKEAAALAHNLLVTVTAFFRDAHAFAALKGQVERYLAAQVGDVQLRVWVPGCATGEEVYSVAMLCSEALGRPPDLDRRLKVFGTDLDEGSLAVARRAIYPSSVAHQIPAGLRTAYTTTDGQGVEIGQELRKCCVFARHNVGESPPFPRIDVVSFRNTLIYFTSPLQERVLDMIHYALLPGGLLFLGQSETIGSHHHGFVAADAEHRIFVRTLGRRPANLSASALPPRRTTQQPAPLALEATTPNERSELLDALVRTIGDPCLVLDERHDVVEVVGDVSPYCRLPTGEFSAGVNSFLREELRAEARLLFLLVRTSAAPATGSVIRLPDAGREVRLRAQPLVVGDRHLTVLTFVALADVPPSGTIGPARDAALDVELERLERELFASQDSLRQAMIELEAVNEELEASAEELQASSEELQATNEELEASNEELQATNEELADLNQQLQLRSDALVQLNTDLENIQASSSQGMVIVDLDMRITRFTPLAVRVFALLETDIGTPLLSISTTVPIPDLAGALREVVAGGPRHTLEARDGAQSYIVQVLPYNDLAGRRCGGIVTLTDVTELIALRRGADFALEQLTRVNDALIVSVWKRDLEMSRILYISGRVSDLTGWSPAEVMADPSLLDGCIEPDDREAVTAARNTSDHRWRVEYRITTRDGQQRTVRELASLLQEGDERFIVGTLTDITNRPSLEQQASNLQVVLQAVMESRAYGVVILDAGTRIQQANDAFREMVGYDDRSSLIGVPLRVLGHPDETPFTLDGVAFTAQGTSASLVNRRLLCRDGTTRRVTVELCRFPHMVGTWAAMAIVQDVTALHEGIERLEVQARMDPAGTGLITRPSFRMALDRELARCRRDGSTLALVWLDLDRFKEVNDQHGHDAGDVALQITAQRLVAVTRPTDIVGRLGGDEFGIVITAYERPAELERLLDRVISIIGDPISVVGSTVTIGGSLGVAIFPTDATDVDGLMRASDTAMYAAKNGGGNSYAYFTDSLNRAAEDRREMREAISASIEHKDFELYYQPIVHSADDTLWGVEALIRWHRDGRLTSAGDFVKFAEENGQIRDLSPLTFGLLQDDMKTMKAAGRDGLRIAINMSVRQLEDPALALQLANWPSATGLSGMVVEVIESVFLPDHGAAIDMLGVLTSHGAQISIDDYGSGFSNLRLLENLSPAYIKLDQSFLTMDAEDLRSGALIRSAIEMAHALGAVVVTEGIETVAQRDLVTSLGTDLLQGFLIAEPMPLSALLAWISCHTA